MLVPGFLTPMAAPGATVFGAMFMLESLARAFLVSVIPLTAYRILQNERDVSILYLCIGFLGLAGTLAIPFLLRRMRRKWVYSLGCLSLAAMGGLIATATLQGLAVGMWLRVFGTAALYTTLNLYIMDYIHKRELVRTEPLRLLFGGAGWTLGPVAGVFVADRLGIEWACAIAAACGAVLLAYFWLLRLRENPAVAPATRPPPGIAYNLRRFAAQPRLRLAYAIAFTRAVWWTMFYIYVPLFMVKAGFEPTWGALVVSLGNVMLFLSVGYGRLAQHAGMRNVVVGGYLAAGAVTVVVAAAAGLPLVAAALLVVGATATTALDALGSIAFLRAVHPYERAEMATVYSTYRQIADITGPLAFALILTFLPLPAVFAATGAMMLAMAWVALYLPRGM
ncbi:MAG: MFS transporter [Rhodospirillales bacterium]